MHHATPASNALTSEEDLLVRFHRDGDYAAREAVIERCMNLVHHIVRRYQNRGIDEDELVQAGAIGLMKAVDRFDPDRGVVFSTFAIPNIAGEIRRHFRDHGWAMRVSRSVQENSALISKVTEQLSIRLQRAPTLAEIADGADLTTEQVLEALEGARHYSSKSLDAPLDSTEDASSGHDLHGAPDPGFRQAEARLTVIEGLSTLRDRERQIVALRFVEDLTQSEIAERMGISQMHVSRLLSQSLDRVREHLQDAGPGELEPLRRVI